MPRLSILSPEEIKLFDKPPRLTLEQRQKYFYLTDKLLHLLKNLRTPTNKVCMILQWGYFRASGRFFLVNDFYLPDVRYISQQLDIPPSNIDLYDYQKKRKICGEHQIAILKAMNFRSFDTDEKQWMKLQLESLVSKHMQPREIIFYLASQCHQRKIEIPSYHYFSDSITKIYNLIENNLLTIIKQNITPEQISHLQLLIDENQESSSPLLTHWKTHNNSTKVKWIGAEIDVFNHIKTCFYIVYPLLRELNLSASSTDYYATWVKKSKLSQLKQMPDKARLYLHLSAFIQHQFYQRQDLSIDIFLKSVQAIRNQAKNNRIKDEHEKRGERIVLMKQLVDEQERLEKLISEITVIINQSHLSDPDKVKAVKNLIQQNHIIQVKINQQIPISKSQQLRQLLNDDTYYNMLEKLSVRLQRRVSNIVKSVDFNFDTSDQDIMNAIQYFKKNDGDIDQDAPTEFLDNNQKRIICNSENKIRTSLYKILLFLSMASCIKAGSLNLKYSYRYKAIQDYLISKSQWNQNKNDLLESAGLMQFSDIEQVLIQSRDLLDKCYHHTNHNIKNKQNLHINFDTHSYTLDTPRLEKKNTETIGDLLLESGFVPIIQILTDINRVTQFVDGFKHFSVKNQKLKPKSETIIAGLMAKGHNIGIDKISHISIGINGNTLRQTVNWFFTLKNIHTANNTIIDFINKLSLSNIFKHQLGITHTASDGQKYQVSVDSLLANYSFKYFGKDKGVSVYTFVDDKHSLFYSTVISASEREAAYVIDGLLHNDVTRSNIHSTDTHGFAESIFAASHFIGTSFAPRFKNFSNQYIYAFSARQTYVNKGYKILPSRTINSTLLRQNWDDVLRFMTTIKLKETSASILFKRLSSYAKDHPLHKAIKEFGRIIKTQFILTYIDDVELRQRIEKQLNRVELSNKFSKAVFFDKNSEFTVSTREEQEIVTACKTLIQNAIILWNYLYLSQRLINTRNSQDKSALHNTIKNGSLMTWQHVNMRGEYDFTKAANNSNFDMTKILSLKVENMAV